MTREECSRDLWRLAIRKSEASGIPAPILIDAYLCIVGDQAEGERSAELGAEVQRHLLATFGRAALLEGETRAERGLS